ncbi:unnamed protein product [Allacma fusca]|uniref:Aldehyde dehydrogenase domain-containing protein n=1 Tax=Allacma fusca TaxID=39272 RepID=A0A8J2LRU2_9HEXA|nr:unnamed protein product [Allacma fusca]
MDAHKTHQQILQVTRAAFGTGRTKKLSFREKQLKNLLRLLEENNNEILQALYKDLRKSETEATIFELELCKTEIIYMLKNLKKYAADEKLPFNWLTLMDRGFIRKEPYGVVLIIGPWNYPITLTIKPLIGAIASGNCAVIKPSEVAPECAKAIAKLLPQYIDPECYPVVLADVAQTKRLLENKFDYIFYTGATSVGSSILRQAAPHLTPVTLELGGKSPCYIDEDTDFRRAACRIMWGKLANMGQTCIAPDYESEPQAWEATMRNSPLTLFLTRKPFSFGALAISMRNLERIVIHQLPVPNCF